MTVERRLRDSTVSVNEPQDWVVFPSLPYEHAFFLLMPERAFNFPNELRRQIQSRRMPQAPQSMTDFMVMRHRILDDDHIFFLSPEGFG